MIEPCWGREYATGAICDGVASAESKYGHLIVADARTPLIANNDRWAIQIMVLPLDSRSVDRIVRFVRDALWGSTLSDPSGGAPKLS